MKKYVNSCDRILLTIQLFLYFVQFFLFFDDYYNIVRCEMCFITFSCDNTHKKAHDADHMQDGRMCLGLLRCCYLLFYSQRGFFF